MRSLLFPVYRLLAVAFAPLAARRLRRAAVADPALAARQPERRGRVPCAGDELWVHAASVGELNAVEPLLRALLERRDLRVVLSTVTHTAAAGALARFAVEPRLRHLFAPLDTPASVRSWLDHTRPRALVVVETELWPVLLDACRRRGIPVAMVNARMSEKAFRRYRRFAGLFRPAVSGIERLLCQSDADRERFEALGAVPARIDVTGNLKFDVAAPDPPSDEIRAWQRAWSGRPVWVAGSTHARDEDIVGRAQRELVATRPGAPANPLANTLTIVVPRHPERAPDTLARLKRAGLTACRIDELPDHGAAQAVVVDRMGVLGGLYRLADACFVGGSLADGIGGHNLLEPALAGKPVLTGPFTADQQAAADGLAGADGLVRVDSATDLARALAGLLEDPDRAHRLGANARAYAEARRGALARTLERLEPWLQGIGS